MLKYFDINLNPEHKSINKVKFTITFICRDIHQRTETKAAPWQMKSLGSTLETLRQHLLKEILQDKGRKKPKPKHTEQLNLASTTHRSTQTLGKYFLCRIFVPLHSTGPYDLIFGSLYLRHVICSANNNWAAILKEDFPYPEDASGESQHWAHQHFCRAGGGCTALLHNRGD